MIDLNFFDFYDNIVFKIFLLLIIFQLKHFFADYPFQGAYMLGKFKESWSFFLPLVAHCAVHAFFTLGITLFFCPRMWWIMFIDFGVHFVMDRIKAGPKYLGRFHDIHKPYFWWSLGFDQMVHHLTHYYLIFKIITG